jgi:NADH:ubiquinone oxidoreductase subunit 5 (subunit L)/multisubunit Na+/H+ antiporter MnhA subunit
MPSTAQYLMLSGTLFAVGRSAVAVMILVVTGIGSLIHIYSTAYMHEEPRQRSTRATSRT